MSTVVYPKQGGRSIVPAADLISLTSNANAAGPARVGDLGFGKRAGTEVVRDAGSATAPANRYSVVRAAGPLPADPWYLVDGTQTYTPV